MAIPLLCSVLLVSYVMWSGASESLDLLLSHPAITLASHVSIILIITHKSFNLNWHRHIRPGHYRSDGWVPRSSRVNSWDLPGYDYPSDEGCRGTISLQSSRSIAPTCWDIPGEVSGSFGCFWRPGEAEWVQDLKTWRLKLWHLASGIWHLMFWVGRGR